MASKILLVEDDNNLREIYEARLQAEGYTIATAKDGEEALVVAKAEKPDLIISDVMMPRISGFEMLDILRNTDELKYTKVIMLTALGQADDKTRANSLGADRYLVKSQVTLEDIVKAAHELIDGGANANNTSPEAAPAPTGVPPASPVPTAGPTTAPAAIPVAPAPPAPNATMAPPATAPPNPQPATLPTQTAPVTPTPGTPTPLEPTVPTQPQPQSTAPAKAPQTPSGMATPAANPSVVPSTPSPTPMATTPPAPTGVPPASPVPTQPTPSPEATAPPAPVIEPESTPPSEPQASTAPATPPTAPTSSSTPQLDTATTAEERATMAAQIEDFVNNSAGRPSAPPIPTESKPLDGNTTTKEDDAVLANAVNDLSSGNSSTGPAVSSPAPAAPSSGTSTTSPTVAPEPPTAPEPKPTQDTDEMAKNNSVTIANKKVIQPLKSEPKPGLDELLAAEEAKNIMQTGYNPGAAVISPTSGSATQSNPATAQPPSQHSGPQPGSTVAPGIPPSPAQSPLQDKPNDFDPNNIAL